MTHPLVEFERPPIVELVLGVQFAPLVNCTSGHLGWFWKRNLGEEWVRAVDTVPLEDQFETFEDQRRWAIPNLRVTVGLSAPHPRLQLSTEAGDRMIQIQPTRFHYNWQKKGAAYPSFSGVRREFEEQFSRFRRFADEAALGALVLNQWEITYIDVVPRGELWQSPADWHKVLPGLFPPTSPIEGVRLESTSGERRYELEHRKGRLYLSVQLGRVGEQEEPALILQTTARGLIGKAPETEWREGLELGHQAAVRTFLQLTSSQAQRFWGLKA